MKSVCDIANNIASNNYTNKVRLIHQSNYIWAIPKYIDFTTEL